MKKKIIYILSTNYAGSHFLSLMLGSNNKAMHIGEVKRLRKVGLKPVKTTCYLCKQDCPVLSDINHSNIDNVYDIIFSRVGSGITTLVDNSKKPFWAEQFLGKSGYQMLFIHLLRDPRAYVRRAILNNRTIRKRLHMRSKAMRAYPELMHKLMFSRDSTIYMYRWLKQNSDITEFLFKHNLKSEVVTYHDLVKNTDAELARLTAFAGLDYEPAQKRYWEFEHHGTQKPDYDWIKKTNGKYFDLRWKEFIPPHTAAKIANNDDVVSYLNKIGISISDEGLVRG